MKKTSNRILTIFLVIALVGGFGLLGWRVLERTRGAADYNEAHQIAGVEPPEEDQVAISDEEESDPHAAALADIDLAALQAINEDVLGWISIPNTELSYPILQATDNQYYLNHTWKKERNPGGSIFMESTNSPDFAQFNTILYGHRMNNDSMFGTLKYYNELDFWRDHPSVYIVNSTGVHRYDIFAAHEVGVRDIVYRLDLEESNLQEDFIAFCLEHSVLDTEIVPQAEDHVLMLSTCVDSSSHSSTRWVVLAVLNK